VKFNDVYKTYFGADYPARTFVGSGALVRGAHFELNGAAANHTLIGRRMPGIRVLPAMNRHWTFAYYSLPMSH
jgi:hypothetical protein